MQYKCILLLQISPPIPAPIRYILASGLHCPEDLRANACQMDLTCLPYIDF